MPLVYMSRKAIYSEELAGQSVFRDFLMEVHDHVGPKHDPSSGHVTSVIHMRKKVVFPPSLFSLQSKCAHLWI